MYNFHCHSLLSDGVLLPSEIAVRFAALGYKAIAITDHVDYSNIKSVVSQILEFTNSWPKDASIKILPGVELTHLPPQHFKPLAKYARAKGIKIIIGHGETPVEPVTKGTNRAALEADIDILAHPGFISYQDALLAKQKNILLEITCRQGHRDTNSLVAERARSAGAKLILNLDSHTPEDILALPKLKIIAAKAGLNAKEIAKLQTNACELMERKGIR